MNAFSGVVNTRALTGAIKDSTEKIMRSFDKPSDDTRTEHVPLIYGSKFTVAKRRLNFLEKNAKGVSSELEKLMNAGAAPSRIERQLKKLNDYESDCVHSLEEVLANVEEEKLTDELLKEWDEFHSQILRISGMAEDFIANNGVNASSSEITEHITDVKLPLLQLPKFSGNVLEWPAFHDAFVASVDSHKKLSNVQTSRCLSALIKTPDERWDMLMKRKGAPTCFNCLQPGSISHNSRTCKAPRCSFDGCGRRHHQLLHISEKSKPNEKDI